MTPTILGMRPLHGFALLGAIALPLLIGYLGSSFTMEAIPTWYAGLVKPLLNPPSWVFGPVWTTLYVLMGIASFLVFRAFPQKGTTTALVVYKVHLLVNLAWSIVFFGMRNPEGAIAVIALLWLMIVWLTWSFYRLNRWAAYLLVPYLLWVSFATYLNVSIALLN